MEKDLNILVAMPAEQLHIAKLTAVCPTALFTFLQNERPSLSQIEEADIIIGSVSPKLLVNAKRLRLLQLSLAGSDAFVDRMPHGALLANASGAYGLAISEHMLAMVLTLMKKLDLYHDNQRSCLWRDEGSVTSLSGATVLTVGVGDIGGEFAHRCKLLGANCLGIRRNAHIKPDYIDKMYTLDCLDELLPSADVVALCLPMSNDVSMLMNEKRIWSMKNGSILLNVGRGGAVDTDALVTALNKRHIQAALDVTLPEPLPKEHPLWNAPGVIITPHISGFYNLKQTHDRIVEIATENLKRFLSGGTLMNLVDCNTGYRKLENRF